METEELKLIFDKTLETFGISKDKCDYEWNFLCVKYQEPHRHYHNLHHLYELFQLLHVHQSSVAHYSNVALAIFYHDLIYDPLSKTNEEDSAILFQQHYHDLLPPSTVSTVYQYIIETKKHDVGTSSDEDLKLFIDFDLAILGSDPVRYVEYNQQIRQEYIVFDDLSFTQGRLKALTGLVSSDGYIYASSTMRSLLEDKAKENMRQEIKRLEIQ